MTERMILIKNFSIWLIIAVLLLIIFSRTVSAISIQMSDANPSIIDGFNKEYSVNLTLTGSNIPDNTKYYLRGVFYLPDSSNYCGFTWNGNSWFSGPYSTAEGWKNFLAVHIASNSASVQLKAKIDTADSGCRTSGSYNFKVQRFTEAGSASFDDQNIQSVTFSFPSSTPLPTVSPKPTKVPTVKPTDKIIDTTATNTVKKAVMDSLVMSTLTIAAPADLEYLTTVNNSTSQADILSSSSSVLGINYSIDEPGASQDGQVKRINNNRLLILLLIGCGTVMVFVAVILSYLQIKKRRII